MRNWNKRLSRPGDVGLAGCVLERAPYCWSGQRGKVYILNDKTWLHWATYIIHRCSSMQASHYLPTSTTPGNWWILLWRNLTTNQRERLSCQYLWSPTSPGPCFIFIVERQQRMTKYLRNAFIWNQKLKQMGRGRYLLEIEAIEDGEQSYKNF